MKKAAIADPYNTTPYPELRIGEAMRSIKEPSANVEAWFALIDALLLLNDVPMTRRNLLRFRAEIQYGFFLWEDTDAALNRFFDQIRVIVGTVDQLLCYFAAPHPIAKRRRVKHIFLDECEGPNEHTVCALFANVQESAFFAGDGGQQFKHMGRTHLYLPPFGVGQKWQLRPRKIDRPILWALPRDWPIALNQSRRFSNAVIYRLLSPFGWDAEMSGNEGVSTRAAVVACTHLWFPLNRATKVRNPLKSLADFWKNNTLMIGLVSAAAPANRARHTTSLITFYKRALEALHVYHWLAGQLPIFQAAWAEVRSAFEAHDDAIFTPAMVRGSETHYSAVWGTILVMRMRKCCPRTATRLTLCGIEWWCPAPRRELRTFFSCCVLLRLTCGT